MATDQELEQGRNDALQSILASQSNLKVVVAGPGTGKSYTFQQLLQNYADPRLALTFLNGLAEGLAADLGDLADATTFHGFSRHLLHSQRVAGLSGDVEYYPPLSSLMIDDLRVLEDVQVTDQEFGGLFRNLQDNAPLRDVALVCGSYYDAVSHDDSVFRVLRHLQQDPDRVPQYSHIVVDEYQDFCPLEVAFIAVLAAKSPVLIAGDDDQAIYAFRDASPDAIRARAQEGEFERFELPFCTRCTEVVVEATHTVVNRAQHEGKLAGRLDKPYICYMPEKREESQDYPKITHARCSVEMPNAPYLGRYIEQQINLITDEEIAKSHEKGYPTVLVIAPKPFKTAIEQYLRQHFDQVTSKTSSNLDPDLLDAYRFLLKDPDSRLGWRILLYCLRPPGEDAWIREALQNDRNLSDLLPDDFRAHHLGVVWLLGLFQDDPDQLSADDREGLAQALDVSVENLDETIDPPEPDEVQVDTTKPTILITSLMGSKGLQAGHVFVAGLNEGHFPRDNNHPTDEEICQLLVALTRTRKKCTVLSVVRYAGQPLQPSVFLEWLDPHLEREIVNKDYW